MCFKKKNDADRAQPMYKKNEKRIKNQKKGTIATRELKHNHNNKKNRTVRQVTKKKEKKK